MSFVAKSYPYFTPYEGILLEFVRSLDPLLLRSVVGVHYGGNRPCEILRGLSSYVFFDQPGSLPPLGLFVSKLSHNEYVKQPTHVS